MQVSSTTPLAPDAIRVPEAMPVPFDALLAYRATLAAALRYIHDVDARPQDGPDRRFASAWQAGGRSFLVTFEGVPARHEFAVALSVAGGTTQELTRLPAIELDPVAASERGLADAAKIAAALGRGPVPLTPPGPASVPAPSLAPDAPGALVAALAPLRGAGAHAAPERIADAARALAWAAFFDSALVPALAARRAADALAFATVAQARAGRALPATIAARWLAPAAPAGTCGRSRRARPRRARPTWRRCTARTAPPISRQSPGGSRRPRRSRGCCARSR